MGLFFTLLYILTAYLAPDTLFGDLAKYHVQIIIAVVTLVASLFSLQGSGLQRMPQTWAWVGLSFAVICSIAFNGWLGGGPKALLEYIPSSMPFFFVVINCRKKIHVQAAVLMLLIAALFNVAQGLTALRAEDYPSHYLLRATVDVGVFVGRIRGLSFINDPNDLAQVLVTLIPLTFLFWGPRNIVRNIFLVLLPVAALIMGTYFTHSRGGMLALLVVLVIAGRRKVGIVPSLILGLLLFVGFTAIGWTGGRGLSAAAGDDRVSAWSVGIGLIRSHPIFGVGFNKFGEYYEITAHNSVVVCAAELGFVGLFFWVLFILPTVRDVYLGSVDPERDKLDAAKEQARLTGRLFAPPAPEPAPSTVAVPVLELQAAAAGKSASLRAAAFASAPLGAARSSSLLLEPSLLASPAPPPVPLVTRRDGSQDDDPEDLRPSTNIRRPVWTPPVVEDPSTAIAEADIHRMLGLFVMAFGGFLTSAWFLSRAYTMTLFLLVGLAECICRIGREKDVIPPALSLSRTMKLSALLGISVLVGLYVLVVFDHLVLRK